MRSLFERDHEIIVRGCLAPEHWHSRRDGLAGPSGPERHYAATCLTCGGHAHLTATPERVAKFALMLHEANDLWPAAEADLVPDPTGFVGSIHDTSLWPEV